MNNVKLIILLLLCLNSLTCVYTCRGQERDFNEQIIGWSIFNFNDPFLTQAGLRYIPDFKSSRNTKDNLVLKTNLSLNAYGNGLLYELDSIETDAKIKPYRLLLVLSGDQFDMRIGLQKIKALK